MGSAPYNQSIHQSIILMSPAGMQPAHEGL